MTTLHTVPFQRTVLATLIGLCLSQSTFALQEISDDGLSETTGEGIALLPEDFSFRLNGLDTANNGQGTYGAGYIRLIPVGPLSTTQEGKGYQKADIYLYGLSLAQSKRAYGDTTTGRTASDWGVPFGAIGTGATDFGQKITSWGTTDNPWVIKTLTNPDVPNFAGAINSVTYLTLEAPLYKTSAITSSDADYNLKLGLWADMFMRDKTSTDTNTNTITGLTNRLRLGAVWDGFSVNGSNLKIFQTLNGVTSDKGGQYTASLKINGVPNQLRTFNYGMSTAYNKTLGFAGLARLNSGATDTTRGVVSNQTITREIRNVDWVPTYTAVANGTQPGIRGGSFVEAATTMVSKVGTINGATDTALVSATDVANVNTTTGIKVSYTPPVRANVGKDPYEPFWYPSRPDQPGGFFNTGVCVSNKDGNGPANGENANHCLTQEGFTTRRLRAFGTNTWTPPKAKSVIRISTQELASAATTDNSTPALGGAMPNFNANANADGIFLYDPNINLVLGNLYQPLMFSTDGTNFSIELARIPNVQEVYKRIYTRYEYIDPSSGAGAVDSGVVYQGSTCNIYTCGAASGGYQGSTATHSSITIGAVNKVDSRTIKGVTYTGLNQLAADTSSGSYGVSIGELQAGGNIAYSSQQDFTQVWNQTRTTRVGTSISCWSQPCYGSSFPGWGSGLDDNGFTAHGWQVVAPKAPLTGQQHPSLNRADPYETTYRQNYNNIIMGIQTTMPQTNQGIADALNGMKPTGGTVANNFGSASIDGLLIQHFKFTTTGL